GAHDGVGGVVAAGACRVLNNELLTEPLREPLSYQTRDDVARTAGAIADDDAYRPGWIGLRPCDARDSRERGSACCEMEKISAGEVHLLTSLHHSGRDVRFIARPPHRTVRAAFPHTAPTLGV